MLLGWDSADPAAELWDTAEAKVGQPLRVRTVYLDLFSGGQAEITLVHARGAAVILCANSTNAGMVTGTLPDGLAYGETQARVAESLGAPPGVGITVDIEASWAPSADWVAGWVYGILARGYRPLVYGSLRAAPTITALLTAYTRYAAVRDHLAVWSATPVLGWQNHVPEWAPDHLIPGVPTVGWQFAEGVPVGTGAIDIDLWDEQYPGLWWPPAVSAQPSQPDIPTALAALRSAQAALNQAVHALRP